MSLLLTQRSAICGVRTASVGPCARAGLRTVRPSAPSTSSAPSSNPISRPVALKPSFTRLLRPQRLDTRVQASGVEGDLSQDEAAFLRRIGWVSFWAQLALTVVSAVVLSFTVGSSMQGALPGLPVLFTLGGVATSFVSTFLAYAYTRVARRVVISGENVAKSGVLQTALNSTRINLIGLFVTLIGLQASVGGLVAKTLSSSTSNPYAAGAANRAAPTSLDVFSVQASTNTIFAHFLSLFFANWLLRKLNSGAESAAQSSSGGGGGGQFISKADKAAA